MNSAVFAASGISSKLLLDDLLNALSALFGPVGTPLVDLLSTDGQRQRLLLSVGDGSVGVEKLRAACALLQSIRITTAPDDDDDGERRLKRQRTEPNARIAARLTLQRIRRG